MAPRVGFINLIKGMACLQQLHTIMLPRQPPLVSEHLLCMAVIVHWEVCRTMGALGPLSLLKHLKALEAVERLVELMMHSAVALPTRVKLSSITMLSKALNQVPVMT